MKNDILAWLRHYVSPAFCVMFFAAFVLWYITKLSYTYTTDLNIDVEVAGAEFEVECVVEGVGTNLFGYKLYKGGEVSIPLNELVVSSKNRNSIVIDSMSLLKAISVRYSDIKIKSIGSIPSIRMSHDAQSQLFN